MHELQSIKFIVIITLSIVFVYSGLSTVDWFKNYVAETSSFSKYIDIKEIYIYNARIERGEFLNDGITRRIVKLNDSYGVDVVKEIECWGTGNWSQIWTVRETWLIEKAGNPKVVSLNKSNPFNVKLWDTCFFRYNMVLVHKWYPKELTIESNVFTIQ